MTYESEGFLEDNKDLVTSASRCLTTEAAEIK